MKVDGKITIGTLWNLTYPLIIAIIFLFMSVKFNFSYKIKGFPEVLESIINFSSIILGFYTAMYGIMIGMMHKDIFKVLNKNKSNAYLKYQLYDSLISSFLVLGLSICLQILRYQVLNINFIDVVLIVTHIWVFLVVYLAGTSFRSISLLIKMMFNNEQEPSGIISSEHAKRILEKLPKKEDAK